MKTKNLIGLDSENAQQVVNLLNELLANYQIYYQNLRGFHWNVRGNRFFVLHAKFEELYNDAIEKVDEIAERILTLGGVPLHSYAAYTKVATLKAKENVTDGDACLRAVVEDVQVLLKQEREILSVAAEIGDDGTQDVFSSFALLCVTRYTPVNTSKAAIGLSQLNTSCPIRIAIMEAMIGCKLLYILAVVGRIRFKAIGTRK